MLCGSAGLACIRESSKFPAGFVSFAKALPALEEPAQLSGLIVWQSNKFSAEGFLLTLLKAVSTGHASFGQMASCSGSSKPCSRPHPGAGVAPDAQRRGSGAAGHGLFRCLRVCRCGIQKSFWLSRLHGQASATSGDGEALETLLANASGKLLDLEVVLTQKAHCARLVAFRSSPEVASRRRQQKKDKRKRNCTQASKCSLVREDWTILVTNITPEQCSAGELSLQTKTEISRAKRPRLQTLN